MKAVPKKFYRAKTRCRRHDLPPLQLPFTGAAAVSPDLLKRIKAIDSKIELIHNKFKGSVELYRTILQIHLNPGPEDVLAHQFTLPNQPLGEWIIPFLQKADTWNQVGQKESAKQQLQIYEGEVIDENIAVKTHKRLREGK